MRSIPKKPADAIRLSEAARSYQNEKDLLEPWEENKLDLSIFVSCYNEAEFIEDTLDTIHQALSQFSFEYETIIIDDISKDNSVELVERYIERHPDRRMILKKNGVNRGLAQNYVDAAFLARGRYYRLICGDNAEPVDTIVTVLSRLGEADMLIPYYVTSEGKSLFRRALSRAFSSLVNLINGSNIRYYNGLAVHLRYNVMRWHPTTRGFGFQAEIICMLLGAGATLIEIPVRTVELKGGASQALTWRNWLSVSHSLFTIAERRVSNWIYR